MEGDMTVPTRRRWKRLAETLLRCKEIQRNNYDYETMHVMLLMLDKRGFVKDSMCSVIESRLDIHTHVEQCYLRPYIDTVTNGKNNQFSYILTTDGKCVRLKSPQNSYSKSKVRNNPQNTHDLTRKTKEDSGHGARMKWYRSSVNSHRREPKHKLRESNCDASNNGNKETDSENHEFEDDEIDDQQETEENNKPVTCKHWKKRRRISKHLRSVFSDKSFKNKLTAETTVNMSLTASKLDTNTSVINSCSEQRPYLTLADFFTTKHFQVLGITLEDADHHPDKLTDTNSNQISEQNSLRSLQTSEHSTTSFDKATNRKESTFIGEIKTTIESTVIKPQDTEEDSKEKTDDKDNDQNVFVLLDRLQSRPDILKVEFLHDYREAGCIPRRFVINLSRLVYTRVALLKRLRTWRQAWKDLTTYLIFSFCKEVGDVDQYRVCLSSTWSTLIKAPVIFKSVLKVAGKPCLVSMGELIQCIIETVDALDVPTDGNRNLNVSKLEMSVPKSILRPSCQFFLLKSVTKWNNGSFSMPRSTEWVDNSKLLVALENCFETNDFKTFGHDILNMMDENKNESQTEKFKTRMSNTSSKVIDSVEPGAKSPTVCSICLTDFSDVTKCDENFPLALQVCCHWFCEKCWIFRIIKAVQSDRNECKYVKCLRKGCSSLVDPLTLLTIIDIKTIRTINETNTVSKISSLPFVKQCSNSMCQRIIFSKTTTVSKMDLFSSITCKCATQACFTCQKHPHWPASCDGAKKYLAFLENSNFDVLKGPLEDSDLPQIVLRGKTCPKCKTSTNINPYNKSVLCQCGCEFCTNCGNAVTNQDEDHLTCASKFTQSDSKFKQSILSKEQKSKNSTISRWYAQAIEHRLFRHPQVISALYKIADEVAVKIKEASRNGLYIGEVRRAALGWKEKLWYWNTENLANVNGSDGSPSLDDISRPVSRSFSFISNSSHASLSDLEEASLSEAITKSCANIVHVTLEVHHVMEYLCVLIGDSPPGGRSHMFTDYLEQAEDLCTALGILLQESHVHQACRILPAFVRLQIKVKQVWVGLINLLDKNSDV